MCARSLPCCARKVVATPWVPGEAQMPRVQLLLGSSQWDRVRRRGRSRNSASASCNRGDLYTVYTVYTVLLKRSAHWRSR
jgi:hypothetical protein